MTTKPNQPDAAIDKLLAALNTAPPPEGMESRIAHRLQQQPAPALPWRDRLIGFTPASAWWRGAATGAAFALLAVTAVLLLQHKTAPRNHIAVTANAPALVATPVNTTSSATPCAQPAILRTHTPAASPVLETASSPGSPASSARWGGSSHPIPSGPLTTQERALIRLAQTADPKVLATLNSEHRAQLQAENDSRFEKFFTPPPPPPQPKILPENLSQPSQSAQPAANPGPASETAPQSEPANPSSATTPPTTKEMN